MYVILLQQNAYSIYMLFTFVRSDCDDDLSVLLSAASFDVRLVESPDDFSSF